MGCLVHLVKIFLGLIAIVIMLVAGYKLIHDPYRPVDNKPTQQVYTEPIKPKPEPKAETPVQTGSNHDYIMANTLQERYVEMRLTPTMETGLVYVIKVFKQEFGPDFTPSVISANDRPEKHELYSLHNRGQAVDIRTNDLPLKQKRRVIKVLQTTLPQDMYHAIWKSQGTENEHLHFESNR